LFAQVSSLAKLSIIVHLAADGMFGYIIFKTMTGAASTGYLKYVPVEL